MSMDSIALGLAQVSFLVAAAPLLNGVIRRVKARFQGRQGPPLLQGYNDITKWLSRSERSADSASFLYRLAPAGVVAGVLAAMLFVPVFSERTPVSTGGDLLVLVGLLALSRAFLTLAGMDSGGAFGQMGASRELAISALVEPVILLSLVALAIEPGSTRLGDIVAFGDSQPGSFLTLGWLLAAAAFGVALVAETGRIPFDNPDTHLELTMVHEGMLLEYSGRGLGILHLANMAKQILLCVVLVNVFLPFGMASWHGPSGYATATLLLAGKLVVVAAALGVIESSFAKMRLFQLPDLLGTAGSAAILAVAMAVLFQ
jgi:formate hydrogenlyase subunit 4